MNRSRVTGDLTASGLLYADIANDRVGIGSTIPGNKLSLPDSAKIGLGNAEDLTLFHDGTNSIIDTNTGDLILRTDADDIKLLAEDDILLRDNDDSTNFIHCINGAGVRLYNAGNLKFETISAGIKVLGSEGGNAEIEIFGDEGDDNNDKWKLMTNANANFYLQNYGAGSWQNSILARPTGATELYNTGNLKLATTTSGIDVTGSVVADDLIVTGTGVVGDLKSTNNNYVLGLAGNNSSVKTYFGTDSSGNFKLATGSGVVERLQINTDGDVDIATGHLQSQDLKLGLAADRYPIIQRAVQSSGSQSLSITGGSGYSEHTGSDHSLVDAREGALIQLGGGDPTSDVYGGYIKYYAAGHTSPNSSGVGNQHVFYTRTGVDTNTERLRIAADGTIFINRDANGGRIYGTGGNLYLQDGNGRQTFRVDAMASGTRTSVLTGGGCLSIGTASPGQPNVPGIHIESDEADDCRIAFVTTNKANTRIGYYGLSNRFGIDMHNGFQIRDAGSSYATRFIIDSNGKVGINDSTPSVTLETVGHNQVTFGSMPETIITYGTTSAYDSGSAGSGIQFGGNYNSTPEHTIFAGVHGVKENTTNAHYAGALVFSTRANAGNSAERVRITSTGRLGVKRSTPLANLHTTNNELAIGANPTSAAAPNATYDGLVVDGEAASFINLRSRGDGNDSYCRLAFSDDVRSRGYIEYRHKDGGGDDTMRFATLGSERMRIDKNGKIIVATGQLHSTRVLASFGIDCQGRDIYDGVGTVSNYGMAFYNDPNTDKANGIGFFNDDGQTCGGYIVHQDKGSGNLGDLIFATSATSNNPVERMRITKDGIVTIGNSLPSASGALHLYQGGNDPYIYIQRGSGDSSTTIGGIFFKNSTNNLALIQAKSDDINDGHMTFSTMGAGTLTQRMKIAKDGRVGIGIDTPEGALHVRADNQGTDTAFFVGSSGGDRFFALNELSNQSNFGNCLMSFYDNSLREILTLRNTYAGQTGMGNMIVWRGLSASKTGDIRVYNTATNSSQSKMDMSASGGVGIEINHLGHVTRPNQPNFLTHGSNDNGSANSTNLLNIGNTYINVGSHYNTGNGRFTCPTGGIYYFYCMWTSDNSTSSPVIYFYVNGSQSQVGALNYNSQYAGTYMAQCFSLNANDYVQCSMRDWNNSTPSPWQQWWGGYLL